MCLVRKNQDGKTGRGAALAMTLILVAGMLTACAGRENYGRLIGARGIYEQMRSGPMGSDYQYFMTPATATPNAIIAIHETYTLKTGSWSVISFGAGQSHGWRVYSGSMGLGPKLLEIQGPAGEHIGLWLSTWSSTVVKMLGDNVVQVYPPNTDTGPGRRDRD